MAYPDCARKTEGKILTIKYHGKTTRYSQIQGKHRKFLDVQNTGRISRPRKKRYRTGPRVERSRDPANARKPRGGRAGGAKRKAASPCTPQCTDQHRGHDGAPAGGVGAGPTRHDRQREPA